MEFESIKYEYIIIIIFLIFLKFLSLLIILKVSKILKDLEYQLRSFPENLEEIQEFCMELFFKNILDFLTLQTDVELLRGIVKAFVFVLFTLLLFSILK